MPHSQLKNPVFDVLHQTKVIDVWVEKKQELITVKATDSVESLVRTLSKHHILSAPVLDDNGAFIGFVDYTDVLRHICAAAPCHEELTRDELETLKIAGRAIALVQVRQIINLSKHNAMLTLCDQDNLGTAVKFFLPGAHRVAIFSKDNELMGVLSQSDIVRFLNAALLKGDCKVVGHKTLEQLGFSHSQVASCDADSTVLSLLYFMVQNDVSAVPLVDGNTGNVVGNFSASNLRGLYFEKFPAFLETAREFLLKYSPSSLNVVGAALNTTLIDAAQQMVDSSVHHLWLLDDFKLVGVFSMSDVLKIAAADLSNML